MHAFGMLYACIGSVAGAHAHYFGNNILKEAWSEDPHVHACTLLQRYRVHNFGADRRGIFAEGRIVHWSMSMAARERKFFVGGNWKMNGTKSSIDGIVEFLKTGPLSPDSGIIKLEVV